MTKLIRRSIILFSLALIFGVTASESHGQVLSEVLKRMDMYNKSLQSLQANVTMEKHNPQLNVTDKSVGTTSYLPETGKRQTATAAHHIINGTGTLAKMERGRLRERLLQIC